MVDAWRLARALAMAARDPAAAAATFTRLERDIAGRGRKAVLLSRKAAAQCHMPRSWRRTRRDLGFRWINLFIGLFSRQPHQEPVAPVR